MDVATQLGYVSALRGFDSTGVLQAKSYGPVIVEKKAESFQDFWWGHKYYKGGNRQLYNDTMSCLVATHVRAATRGKVTDENAHPFIKGDIVGMHNGTLVDQKYAHPTKTDSELLIEDIAERGLEVVLSELNPRSAYALVIYNKKTNEIHFARSAHRPLYFAVHDTRSVIYYASEQWMLRGIANRNAEKLKDHTVWDFSVGRIFSMKINDVKRGVAGDKQFTVTNISKGKVTNTPIPEKKKEEKRLPVVVVDNTVTDQNPPFDIGHNSPAQIASIVQRKDKKKIPDVHCIDCQRKMTLYDQYNGKELGDNTFVCIECETLPASNTVSNVLH